MLVQKQCIFMRFAMDSCINIHRRRNIDLTIVIPSVRKIFMTAHTRFSSTRYDIMTVNGMDASVDKKTFLYNARLSLFWCQTDFIMIRNKLYHDVTWNMPTCKKDFITNLLTAITELTAEILRPDFGSIEIKWWLIYRKSATSSPDKRCFNLLKWKRYGLLSNRNQILIFRS